MRLRRRPSRRSLRLLAIALACGALAFHLLASERRELASLRAATGEPVPVVRAARALDRGKVLAESDLAVATVPTAFAPPGAAGTTAEVVGRALVSDLAEGEVVTATRIGTRAGPIAAQVPPGLRAFAIAVPVPDGALRPGDRVDVLGAFGGPHPWSDTVASGLEVLAVLDPPAGDLGADPSLVLLVSDATAERLAYASAFADLTVSIVGAAA
ncbi:MAG: Flp pilus assembly protein CpaB [Actinomycetota bacterium]